MCVFSLVSLAEGENVAEKLGCRYVETSAKLGINVTETFIHLVCEIRDRNKVNHFVYRVGTGLTHIFARSWYRCAASYGLSPPTAPYSCPVPAVGTLVVVSFPDINTTRIIFSLIPPILYRPCSTRCSGRCLPFLCMRRLGVNTGRVA